MIGSHDPVSLFNQSAAAINRWRLLSEPGIIFTGWILFQACLHQTNGVFPRQIDRGTLQGALGWPSCSLLDTHTHLCLQGGTVTNTHFSHTQTYSTLPRDLWLEPAALTQQCINHWALSSTAGPLCHAELDSTGIKVCNWIRKLIQAKRQLLALKVLIPPCDDTLSLSWDLWLLHWGLRDLRGATGQRSERLGEWVKTWGEEGDEDMSCQMVLSPDFAICFSKYAFSTSPPSQNHLINF